MTTKIAVFEGSETGITEAEPDITGIIRKHYQGGSAASYVRLWMAKEIALEFDEADLMVVASHGIRYRVLN